MKSAHRLLLLFGGTPSVASSVTSYYFDATNGNDNNTGTSSNSALKSLSKIADLPLNTGDRILLKCGETFDNSSIVVPRSGINFLSYGEGAKPIIDQSAVQSGGGWTNYSGSIYRKSITWSLFNPVSSVYENGERMRLATSIANMSAGSWFFVASPNYVYVWLSDNSNPNSTTKVIRYSDSGVLGTIDINGKDDISIDNIEVTRSKRDGITWQTANGGKNISITNCVSSWPSSRGIGMGAYTYTGHDNITISNHVSHDTLAEGFWIGNGTGITLNNCEAYNINKDNTKGYPTSWYGTGFLAGINAVNVTFNRCYSHDIYYNPAFYIEYEEGYNRPYNVVLDRCYGLGNISANTQALCNFSGSNCTIKNSLFVSGYGTAMILNNGGNDLKFYQNDILAPDTKWVLTFLDATNITMKNNIIRNTGGRQMAYISGCVVGSMNIDYNLYHSDNASPGFWYWEPLDAYGGIADWQEASEQDAHAVSGNPLCVNSPTNLHLQTNSPAKYAGTNLGLSTDYDGVAWHNPPSIGAYEFV